MKKSDFFSSEGVFLNDLIGTSQIVAHTLMDDGVYPNNEKLPLLVYQGALRLPNQDRPEKIEELFHTNRWGSSWRNGIYDFQHYHSTAHEVLGVYSGTAKAQFGGEKGVIVSVNPGDVIIIPAGVAHKNLGVSQRFRVVGAYPLGQVWDMNYGKPGERPQVDQNITNVPLPKADPVYGVEGPLVEYWVRKGRKTLHHPPC